jgi:hypothetical protein
MVEEKNARESGKKKTPRKVLRRWLGRTTSRKWSGNELKKITLNKQLGK